MACVPVMLVFIVTPSLVGAVENATDVRAARGDIRSVYGDQRLDAGPARGGGLCDHLQVGLSVSTSSVVWADNSVLVNPPGMPLSPHPQTLVEDRTTETVTGRIPFPVWWDWTGAVEVRAAVTQRDASLHAGEDATFSEGGLVADPQILLFLPAYQDRYVGVKIGAGVSAPWGDQLDWTEAHGTTGYLGSVRATSIVPGISFLSLTASMDVAAAESATNTLWTAPTVIDVKSSYRGLRAGGALLYSATDRLTLGLTCGYRVDDFQDIEVPGVSTTSSETIRSLTYGVLVRAQMPRQTWWTFGLEQEQLNDDADLAVRLAVETNLW